MSIVDEGGGASRSTEPATGSSTGTDVSLREFVAALRAADLRFDTERDRRYAEVDQEREKALKIKETADLAALELAREIQTYKDEKANELREQISSERGLYATKTELAAAVERIEVLVRPLAEFVTEQRAGNLTTERRQNRMAPWQLWVAGVTVTVFMTLVVLIANGRLG